MVFKKLMAISALFVLTFQQSAEAKSKYSCDKILSIASSAKLEELFLQGNGEEKSIGKVLDEAGLFDSDLFGKALLIKIHASTSEFGPKVNKDIIKDIASFSKKYLKMDPAEQKKVAYEMFANMIVVGNDSFGYFGDLPSEEAKELRSMLKVIDSSDWIKSKAIDLLQLKLKDFSQTFLKMGKYNYLFGRSGLRITPFLFDVALSIFIYNWQYDAGDDINTSLIKAAIVGAIIPVAVYIFDSPYREDLRKAKWDFFTNGKKELKKPEIFEIEKLQHKFYPASMETLSEFFRDSVGIAEVEPQKVIPLLQSALKSLQKQKSKLSEAKDYLSKHINYFSADTAQRLLDHWGILESNISGAVDLITWLQASVPKTQGQWPEFIAALRQAALISAPDLSEDQSFEVKQAIKSLALGNYSTLYAKLDDAMKAQSAATSLFQSMSGAHLF